MSIRIVDGVTLEQPLNRESVRDYEPYIIYCDGRMVESHMMEGRAERATKILNEHEKNNGRPEKYKWAFSPALDT